MQPIYYILIFVVIALGLGLGLGLGLEKKKDEGGDSGGVSETVRWVAAGSGGGGYGNLMYSTDGKTWTDSSGGASFSSTAGSGVAYGKGSGGNPLWVAVGGDTGGGYGNLMYSTDGKTWTDSSGGASFSFAGRGVVAYGTTNGTSPMWVAAGSNGGGGYGNLMYSTDGKTWTESSGGASFSVSGSGVAYGKDSGGNPLWVAAGKDGGGYGSLMYSTDGMCWTDSSGGASFSFSGFGVAYGKDSGGNPFWVAAGKDNVGGYGSLMYSTDGMCWTDSSGGASFTITGNGVAYGKDSGGNPLWVAVGGDTGGGYGNLMYSNDGKTWTESSGGASFSFSGKGGHGVASTTPNPALL